MVLNVVRGQTVFVDVALLNNSNIESGIAYGRVNLFDSAGSIVLTRPTSSGGQTMFEAVYNLASSEEMMVSFSVTIPDNASTGSMDVEVKMYNKSTRFFDAQIIAEVLEQGQINIQ